jgi:hypothetical protein
VLVCDGGEPELNGLLRACTMATLMPGSEYPVVDSGVAANL